MSSLRSPRKSLIGEVTSDITLYIISLSNYSKLLPWFSVPVAAYEANQEVNAANSQEVASIYQELQKIALGKTQKKVLLLMAGPGGPASPVTPPPPHAPF